MNIHVAIIPDGNRRWAKIHGLSVLVGHQKGAEALERILKKTLDLRIDCFTFWGASISNLTKRPPEEVRFLNKMFTDQFLTLARNQIIHQNEIRVNVLGFWSSFLSKEAQQSITEVIATTATYNRGMLNFLIAYDGVEEMLQAVRAIISEARQYTSFALSRQEIKKRLLTKDLPPVDLVIRTGGEPHLSAGFMMWDIANAQMVFSEKLWPDYTPEDFEQALLEFQKRERRFGA